MSQTDRIEKQVLLRAPREPEPMTLGTFTLADAPGGTLLTITESGFDGIPLERRAQAFTSNEGGWAHQCKLVEKYVMSAMADPASGSATSPEKGG